MRAGGLLAVVAVLLAGVGAVIVWMTDSDATNPGDVRAGEISDFCALVDTSALAELTPTEEGRTDSSRTSEVPPQFGCEIKLLASEEASEYLAVTVIADARVEETVGDAHDAYSGAIDFEKSEGLMVSPVEGSAEEAGFVAVAETAELREYRAHLRQSNALLSVSLVITGSGLEAEQARNILLTVGKSTLDVMGSE